MHWFLLFLECCYLLQFFTFAECWQIIVDNCFCDLVGIEYKLGLHLYMFHILVTGSEVVYVGEDVVMEI